MKSRASTLPLVAVAVTLLLWSSAFVAIRHLGEKGMRITRFKGLGEMDAEQLWETTMNPASRTLKQVTIDSATEADRVFSMLMGDEVAPRREFIESHAKYARIDA